MLVTVLNFGTNWWARFGRDPRDPYCFTRHAAYYNSTGIRCGAKVRRHWLISGVIRFNGVGDFNPHSPESLIGMTFYCSELVFAFGGNRILFERKADKSAVPDCYLVVLNSAQHGHINFSSFAWKSPSATVIAASRLRRIEETMLLMNAGDWVETSRGFWLLQTAKSGQEPACLEMISAATPTAER
jgi:hypothetical protein